MELAERINEAVKGGKLPLRTAYRIDYIQEARGKGANLQVRIGRKNWAYLTILQREHIDHVLASHGL